MSELARILERLAQLRQADRARTAATLAAAAARTTARPGTLVAGDRVFDLVTGQEGEIAGRTAENIIVPTPDR